MCVHTCVVGERRSAPEGAVLVATWTEAKEGSKGPAASARGQGIHKRVERVDWICPQRGRQGIELKTQHESDV